MLYDDDIIKIRNISKEIASEEAGNKGNGLTKDEVQEMIHAVVNEAVSNLQKSFEDHMEKRLKLLAPNDKSKK
jgi:hypothetical protein